MVKRDMYGNMIRVDDNNGAGGFGVSLTYQGVDSVDRMLPLFTFFHESDGFRQALFSVDFEAGDGCTPPCSGDWPTVSNTFEQRVAEVLKLMPEATSQT